MQQMKYVLAILSVFLVASCSDPVEPTEYDLQFADVVDMKVSVQKNQVTCLLYVQAYNGCQEPRMVEARQADTNLEIVLTTYQANRSGCDTLQSVKKLWHTFTNLPEGTTAKLRVKAARNSKTNQPVDTLITVALP